MSSKNLAGAAIALSLATLACNTVVADPVDDFVTNELVARKIPGLALLVMRDGQVVKERGYGEANIEWRVPVTPETIFQSGSVGKQFTAAGILLLADDGRLALDDTLSKYFRDSPPGWQRITIRQLLTHTSGIKDYGDEFDYRRDYNDEQMLEVLKTLPLEFEPGTRWSYSNSGYVILGLLTTKVAGKDWGEFQAERIFRPLGMNTTRVISERDIVPNRAAGYEVDERGAWINQAWVAPSFNHCADGALYLSIRDLIAWERALEVRRFMQPARFDEWWTPVRLANGTRYPYGYGWFLSEQRGQPVIEHGGSWQGFRAAIVRYPSQQLAVVALANVSTAQPEAIAHAVAGIVEPTLRLRDLPVAPVVADPDLSRRLQSVLEAWADHRVTEAMSPQFTAEFADGTIRAKQEQALARLAESRSFEILGVDTLTPEAVTLLDDGTVRAADARLTTAAGSYVYRFRLDAGGRVVRLEARQR